VDIQHKNLEDVTVVGLAGRLELGGATNQLRTYVRELLASGRTKLLLDLSHLSRLDSAGLGEIVATFTATQRAGGSLKLLSLPREIGDLIRSTKLIDVFEVFDEETAAVRSYH
jgi:anti-sigma B factor antagonist